MLRVNFRVDPAIHGSVLRIFPRMSASSHGIERMLLRKKIFTYRSRHPHPLHRHRSALTLRCFLLYKKGQCHPTVQLSISISTSSSRNSIFVYLPQLHRENESLRSCLSFLPRPRRIQPSYRTQSRAVEATRSCNNLTPISSIFVLSRVPQSNI